MQQYRYNCLLFCVALLPLSPPVLKRGYSVHSYITGLATVVDIGLTLMIKLGTSQCPGIPSKPVRIWNRSNITETKRSKKLMVFYWQTIATYVFGINSHVLQQCFPRRFITCAKIVWCSDNASLCLSMLMLTYSFLKGFVLFLSPTARSKHHCDLAVQTLAPEPASPKSVIQVSSVVEMHRELPVWMAHLTSQLRELF